MPNAKHFARRFCILNSYGRFAKARPMSLLYSETLSLLDWTVENPTGLFTAGFEIHLNGKILSFSEASVYVDGVPRDNRYCLKKFSS